MPEKSDSPFPDRSVSPESSSPASADFVDPAYLPVAETPGSMHELVRVALPLMMSSGSQALMNAADRMIVAGCSEEALAAITPASMLHWSAVCIPMGTVLYANTFISQYEGSGQRDRMLIALWQAIWLALAAGLLLLGCLPFTRTILGWTGHPSPVVELEAQYFNTLCAGAPIHLLAQALSCFYSGRRRTSVVLTISLVAVALNFIFSWLLAFGTGPLPAFGIRGAALGTNAARIGEVLIYVVLIILASRREQLPIAAHWRPEIRMVRNFLRYGMPAGMHYFVDNSGFAAFLLIVGNLSPRDLAATNLAFSVNGLIFVPLLGFGTAIQTLVGHHLGAGLIPASQRTARNAALLGLLWTGATGALLVLLPQSALRPFLLLTDPATSAGTDWNELSRTASTLLLFVAVYSVFDALSVVYASALRGAGDTVFPMVITLLSSWLIMVGPAAWILRSDAPTLGKLWLTCAMNITFTGSCMFFRWRSGYWKTIRLAEH
jgi:MATE family multidrug resistance protein